MTCKDIFELCNPYYIQFKESLVNHTFLPANIPNLQYPKERTLVHRQITKNASNCSKGSTPHFGHPYHHHNNHSSTNCKSTKWRKDAYVESVELFLGKNIQEKPTRSNREWSRIPPVK